MSDDLRVLGPLSNADAVFLDFDGTLADIGPNPDAVTLPADTLAALERLYARLGGALAIISGRDIRDLTKRVPGTVWRIGGHGLDRIAPHEAPPAAAAPPPKALERALEAVQEAHEGVRLERKGPILTLHYRAAPQFADICASAVAQAVEAVSGYVAERGKMVVEAKPTGASKGAALTAMMGEAPFAGRRPLMIGDDITDESAFAAALALGGRAVKVGDGPTAAPLRAESPAVVRAWLRDEADRD